MAPICPYCNLLSVLTDSFEIYGKSYGMIYLCRPCMAWVGVHKGTSTPLGRLADSQLREWKQRAHRAFDPIWRHGHMASRTGAYEWLAKKMKIPVSNCHIGMFDIDECKLVIEICELNYTR